MKQPDSCFMKVSDEWRKASINRPDGPRKFLKQTVSAGLYKNLCDQGAFMNLFEWKGAKNDTEPISAFRPEKYKGLTGRKNNSADPCSLGDFRIKTNEKLWNHPPRREFHRYKERGKIWIDVIRKKRSSMFHSPRFATLDDEAFSKTLAEKDV